MTDRDLEPLRGFFHRLAQRTFGELGLFDAQIVDYLAGVLAEFAHADRLYPLRSATGARLDTIAEILTNWHAQCSRADPLLHQRALRQYVGDYTLFMSGLFRTHVERRGALDLYLQTGSDSYRKVSEFDVALYRTGFLMFQELSEKFEYYSGALDYMRKIYFSPPPGHDPFAHFLKQIEHWVRVGISTN
jgi:hypothetical protein